MVVTVDEALAVHILPRLRQPRNLSGARRGSLRKARIAHSRRLASQENQKLSNMLESTASSAQLEERSQNNNTIMIFVRSANQGVLCQMSPEERLNCGVQQHISTTCQRYLQSSLSRYSSEYLNDPRFPVQLQVSYCQQREYRLSRRNSRSEGRQIALASLSLTRRI